MECSGREVESDIIQRPRSSPDLEGDSREDGEITSKTRRSQIGRRSCMRTSWHWMALDDIRLVRGPCN